MKCRRCGKTHRVEKSYPDRRTNTFLHSRQLLATHLLEPIMKFTIVLAGFILAINLAGCSDPPPPPRSATIESADQAMRNDGRAIAERLAEQKAAVETAYRQAEAIEERRKAAEALSQIATRWDSAVDGASKVLRKELDEPLKKLQAIKAEAEAVAVNECTGPARTALVAAMNTSLEAFAMFRADTAKVVSDAIKAKHNKGGDLQLEAVAQLAKCR